MKIYTRKGDAGETGLFGGIRVTKDDLRIQAYGTIDELNAVLGMVLAAPNLPTELQNSMSRVQAELFQLGAELATPRGGRITTALLTNTEVTALEKEIDAMEAALSPLKSFVLPSGSAASATLHFARTVCRRAERNVVTLHRQDPQRADALTYLNRLSDHLFVCARFANLKQGVADVPWHPPAPAKTP